MSHKYLGQPFDIHVGGVDLIFPHHTNEIAQSECAYGCLFSNFFVHNAHLMVNGEKMSKSKNNFYTVGDLIGKGYDKRAVRYEFLKSNYRQTLDFIESNMSGNKSIIDKFDNFMERLNMTNGAGLSNLDDILNTAKEAFENGMDNDLNTPEALAAVFELISNVNKNYEGLSKENGQKIKELMLSFDTVLGVLPEKTERQLTPEEQDLIDKRQAARVAKDWATADALKAQLNALGIEIKDTPTGPQIRFV